MGNGVSASELIKVIQPKYSEEARAAHNEGTVVMYVVVGTDGRAREIRLVRRIGLGLDENAVNAFEKWTFRPGSKNENPLPVAV